MVDNSNEANNSVGSVRSGISHSSLELRNISESAVLFKIQSTAPIHYHVKPSHGRIEIGEVKTIHCKYLIKTIILFYTSLFFLVTMLSESMKHDKFSVNVAAVLEENEDGENGGDFNSQFSQIPENEIQRYRVKCPPPTSSEEKTGLLAATSGNTAGSTENIISSPMAPSIRSRIPTNRNFFLTLIYLSSI